MKKPSVIGILFIPILFVAVSIYFKMDWLLSVACVIFIFYILMALRGKFSDENKNEPS